MDLMMAAMKDFLTITICKDIKKTNQCEKSF